MRPRSSAGFEQAAGLRNPTGAPMQTLKLLASRIKRHRDIYHQRSHPGGRTAMNRRAQTPPRLPERPRILVISLRRIGDLLLATPLIRSLRRAWSRDPIDPVVLPGTTEIVQGNPDIEPIIVMPRQPTFQ